MTIRCKSCHATVWVQPAHEDSGTATVSCAQCGQDYVLESWERHRRGGRTMSATARQLAGLHGIDLPGAYSLLFGIMTLDELRGAATGPAVPGEAAESISSERDPAPEDPKKPRYDRGFEPAVQQGLLTARQAAERGNREAYAALLGSRHRIRESLAYDVADNRISLLHALRARGAQETAKVQVAGGGSRRHVKAALLTVLVVLLGSLLLTQSLDRDAPLRGGRTRTVGEAEIRTDLDGRVVQVVAPDPRAVLRQFCANGLSRGRLEPLEIVPSLSGSPEGRRARVGLLRDPQRPEELLAITIREDRTSGRWIAGDGYHPLVPGVAPAGAERAVKNE